ncbi:MAG: adenosylmethionine--8-amino-7-oxononanoate transaminase [Bacteroidetes bacterium]|nr:adenosylmethionine--8-amino-7-oxononanoate transaminase [Bacteroidota bacterium]
MSLAEKDKQYIWHPFTHLKYAEEPLNLVRGEGAYFIDDTGNRLFDGISSWWVNLHGHCHPYISKKVSEQLFTLEHAMFSGFTHQPAVQLAERLMAHLPGNQSKIFYSDNGSTAVEVALKMVIQYWHNLHKPKHTFIALENAYHGDTFGGMSVGERNVFNQAFGHLLFDVVRIPLPNKHNIEAVKEQFSAYCRTHDVAGFIFEPLVQGAAGMLMYEASYLDELIELAREQDVITIADEVMTGFGRTGRFFAVDYLEHKPDIMCLSKGLTGGYMPLGVTSCAQFIYNAYISDDKTRTFFHGHSYTANPTACSAALASLDLMEEEGTWKRIAEIEAGHHSCQVSLMTHPRVRQVRCRGTILAVELHTAEHTHYLNRAAESISEYFVKRHILLRPLGNILYVIPPYCSTGADLEHVYKTITEFLNQL